MIYRVRGRRGVRGKMYIVGRKGEAVYRREGETVYSDDVMKL